MDARTPKDLGPRSTLLVDKHAAYIKSFNRIWEGTDSLEFVATEHFWMSGIYWGLSAMAIMGRLDEMGGDAIVEWIIRCWRPDPEDPKPVTDPKPLANSAAKEAATKEASEENPEARNGTKFEVSAAGKKEAEGAQAASIAAETAMGLSVAAAEAAEDAEAAAAELELKGGVKRAKNPCSTLFGDDDPRSCTCIGGGVRLGVSPRAYVGGGFGASERNDPHLLATCSAVQILALYDKLHLVDVDKVVNYVCSLQNDDGSFCGDAWGEVDTRFTYCAFLTLSILGRLRPRSQPGHQDDGEEKEEEGNEKGNKEEKENEEGKENDGLKKDDENIKGTLRTNKNKRDLLSPSSIDVDRACDFIARCRNFDGGFGCTPGNESHSGQVFTCVAALTLAGRMDLVDPDLLGWWIAERQTPSGGLNGRPEKLQDVCYSWWCLSSLAAMGRLHWVDGAALKRFVLFCQDEVDGGISDRPEDLVDIYHTFFGVAALALLGEPGLNAFDPVWALPVDVVQRIKKANGMSG